MSRLPLTGAGRSNDDWVVPTDIPAAEASELKKLYRLTDGDNWTVNTNWGLTATASNWNGITVVGGKVQQISLGLNNLVGSLASFQPSVFTTLTILYFNQNAVNGVISNWVFPTTLVHLRLHNSNVEGVVSGILVPAVTQRLLVYASSLSSGFDMSGAAGVREYLMQSCALVEASVDAILESLYDNWATFTFATPDLNVGGTCPAPSGTEQDATPPEDGNEFKFKLINDPDATGNNTWTITAN